MIRRRFHILLLLALLWLPGCEINPEIGGAGDGIVLTVRCADPVITKADQVDGEYNENLIRSVDFLFYVGENPAGNQNAAFYIRKEQGDASMQGGDKTATFTLNLKKYQFDKFFTAAGGNKAVVYALVNFDDSFIDGSLASDGTVAGTSRNVLEAKLITTDFTNETNYLMPSFLMDGRKVLTYSGDPDQPVTGDIDVTRFAAKLTLGLNVAPQVVLKHTSTATEPVYDETWVPVLHTMRVYLVDGVKTVKLSGIDDSNDAGKFFSYRNDSNKRPYVKDDDAGTNYVGTNTVDGKEYIETYPMYSYPREWGKTVNYDYDFTSGLPPEQPYFKLEMDWRRVEDSNYSYDRRKYYYKIYIPFEKFERNNWYAFYLDVAILGSETDEGKAHITPSCYVLDWQNRAVAINKAAVISKARYLSVENNDILLRNQVTVNIPFISSHNVKVVPGSVSATRPYYGSTSGKVNKYNETLHAYVRQKPGEDKYYLEYQNQPATVTEEVKQKYEPINWFTPGPTSVEFNHPLVNDYTVSDFDYSPYTITFKIVHDDLIHHDAQGNLIESDLYLQYVKEITITQYPAIYIDAVRNSDTYIKKINGNGIPYGYDPNLFTREQEPWGYVYIDGGRFVRVDKLFNYEGSQDPFWQLTTDNNKREYQWRTVWYTGGSMDLFRINVSVLPKESNLVIGDPRVDEPVDAAGLGYSFTRDGEESDAAVLKYESKNNFSEAKSVEGTWRTLQHYYMTEETDRTKNMLAPSYRIASKFGGTEYGGSFFSDISRDFARYRCAAYQEDGFPAGRWRLPTEGEILFIAQLSAKGAFEPLFSKNSTYWSANGAVKVGDGTVTVMSSSVALLRCVYDSWYWGDEQHEPRTEFVWGDKLK